MTVVHTEFYGFSTVGTVKVAMSQTLFMISYNNVTKFSTILQLNFVLYISDDSYIGLGLFNI